MDNGAKATAVSGRKVMKTGLLKSFGITRTA